MFSVFRIAKTLPGTAKTANFQQKIAESIPGTAKTAKLRFSLEFVAAIASIGFIAAISADIN